jgi:Tol biopolymer transport system component
MTSLKFLIVLPIFLLSISIFCVAQKGSADNKQILLMNRIGPSASELFIANADGSDEHLLLSKSGFDYHASYSANGQWISFTSERNGSGQAEIYRVHPDGSGLERLTDNPALDDQSSLSPDGSKVAFVSTRISHTTNIWILDTRTKKMVELTGKAGMQGDPTKPDGFFHPSWSPDGKWIAFSSDRNTEWLGHGNGSGWEHVQELSIYIVHPDGTGFRRLTKTGLCDGAPKWSPDGKKIVYYEIPVEDTWAARRPTLATKVSSQIFSVDINSGERVALTSGPGLKVLPQYLDERKIGFLTKVGPNAGLSYIGGGSTVKGSMRSPCWSPDRTQVIYEKVDFTHRTQNEPLYSWDKNYDYRYTDVFPNFSKDGKLVVTDKDFDSGISIMDPDGSNKQKVFTPADRDVAFMPTWSPDGQWIAFGYGGFLQSRKTSGAKIMMVRRDGTGLKELTKDMPNAGFPSFSPDGKKIVYRSWGAENDGLRILNLEDNSIQILTTDYDNLPFWSPDGKLISFTRKHEGNNFDIYTIKPDGTDLRQLTTSPANDAHAFWTADSKHLMWSSGIYGFKDEVTLYDNTFQPYGAIFIMDADGANKKQLTDSPWEDSMPVFAPKNKGK